MKRMQWLLAFLAVSVFALAGTLCSYNVDAHAGQPAADAAKTRANPAVPAAQTGSSANNIIKVNNVAAAAPNDPYYQKQWALPLLKTAAVAPGEDVIVAILDSGIDATHEDLSGRIAGSVNFTASPTESDVRGHGTHIAGIVAANTDNNIGIAGVAANVKLLNVKVAEDNGQVWSSTVAKGITWAVDHGARIINMSLTLPESNKDLAAAVKYAGEHGVILVAATGNRVVTQTYPSAYANVIGVAALNPDGTVWSGSSGAQCIDLYAPGFEIYSTVPGNKYAYKSGSSMAAAYVSGLAADMIGNVTDTNRDGSISDELQANLAMAMAALKK
jgi:thermitase